MNHNIAEQLRKTLEDPEKCKSCRYRTAAYDDDFVVMYCYRKWFLGKGCEVAK